MAELQLEEYEIPTKAFSARFRLLQKLGSGSFGTVSLYKMSSDVLTEQILEMEEYPGTLLNPLSIMYKYNNGLVAIKTMNKKLKRRSDYTRIKEIQFIFSVSSHFNLVQIIDVFIDRSYCKLNIVMENMDQNLYQLMKARNNNVFSPRTLKSVLSQLLSAISHIHKHMFFHRDVKPENILVMQNLNYFGSRDNIPPSQRQHSYIIKLADYGLARHESNEKQFTAYVSTRWYRSPEILFRNQYYSYPIDIWAFGCVAVECATFFPLFPGKNELDQCYKIMDFLGNPNKSFQLMALQSMNKPDINSGSYNDFSYDLAYDYQSYAMIPFGGFWPEAAPLATNLGLMFPKHFGYRLENLIKRNDFTHSEKLSFFQMIKSCLTWNPNERATSTELMSCPYFEGGIFELDSEKENIVNVDSHLMGTTQKDDNMKKSMLFAGISPTKPLALKNGSLHSKKAVLNKLTPGLGIQSKQNISNNILGNLTSKRMSKEKSYESTKSELFSNSILTSDPLEEYADIIIGAETQDELNLDEPQSIISNTRSNEKIMNNELTNLQNVHIQSNSNLKSKTNSQNLNYLTFGSEDLNNKNYIYPNEGLSQMESGEEEDVDESEESEEDLIPLDYNDFPTLLEENEPNLKMQNANIAIKSRTEGNYDLIDAINYALDDEFKLANDHTWNNHS